MYGIYLDFQRIGRADRFSVLPSGALECKELTGAVTTVYAPGSWDHVVAEDTSGTE